MTWEQIATLIAVGLAMFGSMVTLMIWCVNKLDSDIKGLSSRIDSIAVRMDASNARLDGHAQRIDQLYKMFVDLLKERK